MSASAGRVLLIPKGDYNPSTTYTMLDEVFYQGSSYVCKKTSLGNAPTNTEYWQIMSQGLLAGNFYGTCSTGASTAEKEVVIPSGEHFSLQLGDIIGVKFTYTNTAISPELNVNNTGAKHIYYNNATVSSEKLWAGGEADRITVFQYDGTNWVWIAHDVDEHIENASELGIGIGTSSTAESTTAKEATLANYEAMTNGVVAVRFTYAVPANSTLNINNKGAKAIYYKNSAIVANVIKAGDTVTFFYDGTYYHIVSIDRSEGHVVQDASGTSMTNRGKLQFPDANVSDDSTNDRTIVEVMQEPMTREDFEDAVSLEDGIYPITTDDSTIISSDMVSHGSGTVEDALNKKLTLLWENSNPSTSFVAQNIDVTCGKIFKSFLVEFRYYSSSTNMISPTTCGVGYSGMALFFGISGSGRVSSMERDVTPSELADGYRFAFTGCGVKDLTSYGSAPSTSTDNSGIIPLRIWGIG